MPSFKFLAMVLLTVLQSEISETNEKRIRKPIKFVKNLTPFKTCSDLLTPVSTVFTDRFQNLD